MDAKMHGQLQQDDMTWQQIQHGNRSSNIGQFDEARNEHTKLWKTMQLWRTKANFTRLTVQTSR